MIFLSKNKNIEGIRLYNIKNKYKIKELVGGMQDLSQIDLEDMEEFFPKSCYHPMAKNSRG